MEGFLTIDEVVAAVDALPADTSTAAFVEETVYPQVRDLVAAHRRRKHQVVLVSGSTPDQLPSTPPVLRVDGVVFRGTDINRFAAKHGIDLAASHGYTTSHDDLAMLSSVGTARPSNPDRELAAEAERLGWPVLRIDRPSRLDPPSVVRTVAAYGSMVTSMLGGVAIGVLNRDRNEIVQYGISSWIQRLFAITGVKLHVHGEEHLWSHRPAVFIYNHRNNFDPYIALKLVGRDWGAVGKKELAGPLSGVMQWVTPNVAYVDRSNQERAIKSLQSVTALLHRGVSVVVAPEGTRSRTGEVGPFKKGPFRMALEAGVPVVPIVIRNADAIADRDASVIHKGTIDVAVLPPVSVTDWKPDQLEERVAGVRELFVDTLDNWPGRTPADARTPRSRRS